MSTGRLWTGLLDVEICSADISKTISTLTEKNIPLDEIRYIDQLKARVIIRQIHHTALQRIVRKDGGHIEVIGRYGAYWKFRNLLQRPVLIVGLLLFIALSIYIPSRVFFFNVEGNTGVPERYILEKAAHCGMTFGVSRAKVRSERVKNHLLSVMPQLQWVGITTKGCVATISVKERKDDTKAESSFKPSSIIASRDGVVTEITVLEGKALCNVGQAVKEGQVLVSCYDDRGLFIKLTNVNAEVFAETNRNLTMISPTKRRIRTSQTEIKNRYSLLIGKKLINFCKDSGISDTECVRMYEERYITLPGDLRLPIALVRERCISYTTEISATYKSNTFSWLTTAAERYIKDQMLAGQIINSNSSVEAFDGVCLLLGRYRCEEMIGNIRDEEFVQEDGKRD